MTSNQIAYAGNLIQQQAVDEQKRHNEATEALTYAAQELERNKLDLDKWYKEQSVAYNQQMLYLEEKYKYQADLALRTEIEERMREVEFGKLALDREYKTKSLELDQWRTINQANQVAEQIRSNKAAESLKAWSNRIDEKRVNLQKYEIDTNAFFNFNKLSLDNSRLDLDRLMSDRQYNLGMAKVAQEQRKLNLESEKFDFSKTQWAEELNIRKSQTGNQWTNTILPFVLPTASSVLGGAVNYLSNW